MNKEMKWTHSPGPWSIRQEQDDGLIPCEIWSYYPGFDCPVCHVYSKRLAEIPDGRKEFEANARLIAAAPCLAEYIERWADVIQGGDKMSKLEPWAQDMVSEARALLDRIEGKGTEK